jgi:hypothetical protein
VSTKITKLTEANIQALNLVIGNDALVQLTATTATFVDEGTELIEWWSGIMSRVAAKHGRHGHPYASLHAVTRKVNKAAQANKR